MSGCGREAPQPPLTEGATRNPKPPVERSERPKAPPPPPQRPWPDAPPAPWVEHPIYAMTNVELADAINWTRDALGKVPGGELQRLRKLEDHFYALLDIQLERAKQMVIK